MIFVKANTRRAVALSDDLITTGSAGIEVSFLCSAAWEGLSRTVIFHGGDVSVDVSLSGDSCTVPPEVLTKAGGPLLIGLYGTDGTGSLAIPTVWADAGRIFPGAVPSGIEPTPETAPLIDQLLAAAQQAQEIAQSVRDDADNGEFDGATGPQGTPGRDGADGSSIWWTEGPLYKANNTISTLPSLLFGKNDASIAVGDLVYGPPASDGTSSGSPTFLYRISAILAPAFVHLAEVGSIKGEKGNQGDAFEYSDFTPEQLAALTGPQGNPGSDGVSPTISVTSITGGHRVNMSDARGDHEFDVMDGADGQDGQDGGPGPKGDPGSDGVSPTISVTEITGGHRVNMSDATGDHEFDVMDGEDGSGMRVWWTDEFTVTGNPATQRGLVSFADLRGPVTASASTVSVGDYVFGPTFPEDAQTSDIVEGDPLWVYRVMSNDLGNDCLIAPIVRIPDAVDLSVYRTAAAQDVIDAALNTAIQSKLPATGNAYRSVSIPMGQLDSTSTSTVMTAQVDGITELRDGVCVWLRNGVVNAASGVTLNINGLGAKPIYNSLTGVAATNTFTAASTYLFVYNATRVTGGCWDKVDGFDTNTTYSPVKLGFGYATCSTAASTAAKTASLSSYTLTTGGYVTVRFTNAVGAGATLNINSKGAKSIYYRGAAIPAGVIHAGDTVTFVYSSYYHIVAIIHDDGIPKTEMDAGVQASLDKADTALQPSSLKTVNGNSLVGSGNVSIPALPAVTSADNDKVMMVINGEWAAGELPVYNGEIVTPAYNVTVTLTNPKNSSSFQSCTIRTIPDESDVWDYGEVIGTISSPTGSTEVSVSGVYGIVVQFSGSFVNVDGDTTCTGGVSKIPGSSGEYVALAVSGDGTAVIDQVDYDD